jgi:hypothetical protein
MFRRAAMQSTRPDGNHRRRENNVSSIHWILFFSNRYMGILGEESETQDMALDYIARMPGLVVRLDSVSE